MRKLGIIAGGRDLPLELIERCRGIGRPHFVLAFKGQTDPATVKDTEHAWVHIGAVGQALNHLRRAGVEELVMVGPLRRPSWTELRPDAKGALWVARLTRGGFGDDSLLRIITEELEKEGFKVVGVESLMGEDFLALSGVMGTIEPDVLARQDIKRGVEVALALGKVDVGQAVIIQQGMVLGVEGLEGTDGLIERCQALARPGPGGILVKIAKPGQERRVDLPTMGPDTIERAIQAGLRGIAVEAGSVQILHHQHMLEKANQAGIFIIGVNIDDYSFS
ncbi:MAG: UDP-2,3-diacylglucosamine diphosphatase LpxI [Alphaproteobacteria bacterium]|nr:UDP-2,3-diacylglucosamine diphosphatase LpxI [Alphaproteobacteria bacterium]